MVRKKGDKMILISVHVPEKMLEELDELVKSGIFPNRSEAIRAALREVLLYWRHYSTTEKKVERKPQKEIDFPEMEKMILKGRQ